MRAPRRRWLAELRHLVHERGVRGLWDLLYDDLHSAGKPVSVAFGIARRRAAVATLLLLGLEQPEIAMKLGKSIRTIKYDEHAIRRAIAQAPYRPSRHASSRLPMTPDEVRQRREGHGDGRR